MSALDFDKKTEEAMSKLEVKALAVLTDVLDGQYDGASDDERLKIRVAQSALAQVAKNRQTSTAREAFRFSVADTIAKDPKALEKYVESTMPQVKKALAAG